MSFSGSTVMNSGCTHRPSGRAGPSLRDGLQVGRADVGAVGEAEIDQHQLAAEVGVGAWLCRCGRPARTGHRPARGSTSARPSTRRRSAAAARAREQPAAGGNHDAAGKAQSEETRAHRRYALKVRRLPVEVWITPFGICARASSMKLRPLQCIGMSTSGSSFLISAMICLR